MDNEQAAQSLPPGEENLEAWCFVEIMGHNQLAGRVSTRKFGVNVMIQIDVPKDPEGIAYTKLYGPASIFSITPTSEEYCRQWARTAARHFPVVPYIPEARPALGPGLGDFVNTEEDPDQNEAHGRY